LTYFIFIFSSFFFILQIYIPSLFNET